MARDHEVHLVGHAHRRAERARRLLRPLLHVEPHAGALQPEPRQRVGEARQEPRLRERGVERRRAEEVGQVGAPQALEAEAQLQLESRARPAPRSAARSRRGRRRSGARAAPRSMPESSSHIARMLFQPELLRQRVRSLQDLAQQGIQLARAQLQARVLDRGAAVGVGLVRLDHGRLAERHRARRRSPARAPPRVVPARPPRPSWRAPSARARRTRAARARPPRAAPPPPRSRTGRRDARRRARCRTSPAAPRNAGSTRDPARRRTPPPPRDSCVRSMGCQHRDRGFPGRRTDATQAGRRAGAARGRARVRRRRRRAAGRLRAVRARRPCPATASAPA